MDILIKLFPKKNKKYLYQCYDKCSKDVEKTIQYLLKPNPNLVSFQYHSENKKYEKELSKYLKMYQNLLKDETQNKINLYQNVYTYDCEICMNDYEIDDMYILNCNHKFCRSCLKTYLEDKINSFDRYLIPCPLCQYKFTSSEISHLISKNEYERYLDLLCQDELKKDEDVIYCPKCESTMLLPKDLVGTKIKCLNNKCNCEFCFKCKIPYTENHNCKDNENNSKNDLSLNLIETIAKKCPHCHTFIEKADGCNHMKCSNCNGEWCWVCNGKYEVDHYINGTCNQF